MSIWQLFHSMFLKNERNDNELSPPPKMYLLLNFFFNKRNKLQQSIVSLFSYDYNFESNR
jgi:hypothetical protein